MEKTPIEVKNYDKYDAPVDNKNIAYLEIPNIGIHKCFQMTPGIWVTPEKFYENTPKDRGLCNQYLKNISLYFRRINFFPIGEKFFKAVSKASPYKYYKEYQEDQKKDLQDKIVTVFIVDGTTKKRIGVTNMSILVKIGEELRTGALNIKNDNSSHRKSYGNISVVEFYAQYITKIILKESFLFQDPIITLFHELIHAFHNIYNYHIMEDKVTLNDKKYMLEEIITHGGSKDLDLLKDHINDLNKQYLNNIQNIINNLNKSKKSAAFKAYYASKYFLEKIHNKYQLIDDGKNLINLIQNTFTEVALLKASKQLGYAGYYDAINMKYYPFNPYDKRFYNLQHGFNNQMFWKHIHENKIEPIN